MGRKGIRHRIVIGKVIIMHLKNQSDEHPIKGIEKIQINN